MPRPNFGKLKASSAKERGSDAGAKKQMTISRFFSKTGAQSSSGVSVVEDEPEVMEIIKDSPGSDKERGLSPVKSVKVQCQFRKRNASSSPDAQRQEDGKKRLKLTSPSSSQSQGDHGASPAVLSSGTISKLSSFNFQATPNRSNSNTTSSSSSKLHSVSSKHQPSTTESASQDSGLGSSPAPSKSNRLSSFKNDKAKSSTSSSETPRSSKRRPSKSAKSDYTPLEQQFMEIKEQHPDVVLFVECGYRYRFFGDDAEIAAKELNIFCHLDHNFMVASIPVYRLFVHARRLVAKGYKVGVVKQTETAALKAAGVNKNAPFKRKLAALYTKSTMIGEDVDPVCNSSSSSDMESDMSAVMSSSSTNQYLLCLTEVAQKKANKSDVQFGLVAVQPATGDIIYDCFHDNQHLSELDTRLHHLQPVELLIPHDISDRTEKLLRDFSTSSPRDDDRVRIEKISNEIFDSSTAFEEVSAFYKTTSEESEPEGKENDKLQEMINLPLPVVCCLAAVIKYLKEFRLQRVLKEASHFVPFSAATAVMKLNGCALRNLEIFRNQTDGSERGTLFWVLNHTSTRFGKRMLQKWMAQPLMDASKIQDRQDAIAEILEADCQALTTAKNLLAKSPDLERGLCSIYHKKCSTSEFVTVVKYLCKLSTSLATVQSTAESQLKSSLLKDALTKVPKQLEGIEYYLNSVDEKEAREGVKTKLFVDTTSFPAVQKCKDDIEGVLAELKDHRKEVRRVMRNPSLDYVTVSGIEFMVEVRNSQLKTVPKNWTKISSTKQVSRFHSPFIVEAYKRLSQLREQLTIECQQAWLQFLDKFGEHYFAYRQAIQHLASLDCLFSLAKVASQDGFSRPEMSADTMCIEIENGRHPIVSSLLTGEVQFVPNDTHMQADGQRCMIITGPNMGGKSSYIKQVALICIMAQIGSYVPAESAKLGILDAVYTRMGASDNIYQNRSTFMVELLEASDIISHATNRSLVILDELGRGTSTHDGVAIAHATAKHFISEVQCMLLFVTHYPPLADLEKNFPDHVANYHMSFLLHDKEEDDTDDIDVITFLYQLVRDMADKSYGLNVAKLAKIPHPIIKVAAGKSTQLETAVKTARGQKVTLRKLWNMNKDNLLTTLKELANDSH